MKKFEMVNGKMKRKQNIIVKIWNKNIRTIEAIILIAIVTGIIFLAIHNATARIHQIETQNTIKIVEGVE